MKRSPKKSKKITKGMSSAVVLSIVIHAALFLLAGMLVVFTVVKKEEQKFEPPKVIERPKMKLKKPKVKIKKSKPKPTTRIVTKMNRANMPQIQLPEMSSMSEGLGSGIGGGFDLMPDLNEVTIFGSAQSIGNDFEGVIYDFKRDRNGGKPSVSMAPDDFWKFKEHIEKFIKSGWKSSALRRFYQSPRTLYTPTIMIPPIISSLGPWAFGEPTMYPYHNMLHYKGQLVHRDGIRFRFVVMADNFLLIRLDGKVVMDYKNQFEHALSVKRFKPTNYHLGHWYAYATDWIELDPGIPQEMEVICGDYTGGLFATMIAVEVEGVEYPRAPTPQDNPVLPIFKTSALSADQIDAIYEFMWEGHLMVTNGPIFSDYETESLPVADLVDIPVEMKSVPPVEPAQRTWTLNSGKNFEAEYVMVIGGNVVLKSEREKVIKVPLSKFSAADLKVLELLNPPDLKLDFKKHTSRFEVLLNPKATAIPTAQNFAGGVVVKQQTMKEYTHPLRIEMYVIAGDYDGNNFILLDRQIEGFMLTTENKKIFELKGDSKVLRRYDDYGGVVRGEKYQGHMILVYDQRGEIIAQKLTHTWLLDLVEPLRLLPIGRHFNKEGKRVHPPRPKFSSRYWSAPADS